MSADSTHDELIAGFIDGEMAPADLDRLLARLQAEPGRALLRGHLNVQSAIRGGALGSVDISSGVRAALRHEPALRQRSWRGRSPAALWSRRFAVPAGGFALAASVGMAAILLEQPQPRGADELATPLAVTQAEPVVAPQPEVASQIVRRESGHSPQTMAVALNSQEGGTVAAAESSDSRELVIAAPAQAQRPVVARWSSAPSGEQSRQLDSYLINHARHGGGYGLSAPLGYARIAAQSSPVSRVSQPQVEPSP